MGGSVVLRASEQVRSLAGIQVIQRAEHGKQGRPQNRTGAPGASRSPNPSPAPSSHSLRFHGQTGAAPVHCRCPGLLPCLTTNVSVRLYLLHTHMASLAVVPLDFPWDLPFVSV